MRRTCVTAGVRLYVATGDPLIIVECREPAELDEPARACRFRFMLNVSSEAGAPDCADGGREWPRSLVGVRAPFALPKECLLASLRLLPL